MSDHHFRAEPARSLIHIKRGDHIEFTMPGLIPDKSLPREVSKRCAQANAEEVTRKLNTHAELFTLLQRIALARMFVGDMPTIDEIGAVLERARGVV